MKKLIEILPNIYGVKVPMDAEDFEQSRSQYNYNIRLINYSVTHPIYFYQGESVEIGDFNFKILGTITATEISFDASEVVESTEIDVEQYDGILMAIPRFWDYELESFSCSSSDESFRSALPKEIFFEHPQGKLDYCCNGRDCGCLGFPVNIVSKEHWEEYQEIEQNITQKLLILQKL